MKKIIIQLSSRVKVALRRLRRQAKDAGLAMRCQTVLFVDLDCAIVFYQSCTVI